MSASLSFNSTADHKSLVDTGRNALPGVSHALGVGCAIGTAISFVAPVVAPAAGAVCLASKVTGVANNLIGPKK